MKARSCTFAISDLVFEINADIDIVSHLPQRFQDYLILQNTQAFAVFVFSEQCIGESTLEIPHWVTESHSSGSRLTYYPNQKSLFSIFCRHPVYQIAVPRFDRHTIMLGMQHAIMLALSHQCLGFHGVTLICKDRVVILSAPSGTGKTTLAMLLREYCDAAIVNGDFALLTPSKGQTFFEPTPFCGSSGIAHKFRLPIDHIVFLRQAKENVFCTLNTRQALSQLMSNSFIPPGDPLIMEQMQTLAISVVESVRVSSYAFEPTHEAATFFHDMVTK